MHWKCWIVNDRERHHNQSSWLGHLNFNYLLPSSTWNRTYCREPPGNKKSSDGVPPNCNRSPHPRKRTSWQHADTHRRRRRIDDGATPVVSNIEANCWTMREYTWPELRRKHTLALCSLTPRRDPCRLRWVDGDSWMLR